MSRDFKLVLAILIPVVAFVAVWQWRFSGVDLQGINMKIAEERLPRVQGLIAARKKFKDVQAFVYTGQNAWACLEWLTRKNTCFSS